MSNCRVMCFRAFSFVSYSVYRPIFCLMCMICVFYSCEKIVKENRTMFCYHFLLVFFYFPSSTFSSNSFSSYTSSSSPLFHFFHSLIHIFHSSILFFPFFLFLSSPTSSFSISFYGTTYYLLSLPSQFIKGGTYVSLSVCECLECN